MTPGTLLSNLDLGGFGSEVLTNSAASGPLGEHGIAATDDPHDLANLPSWIVDPEGGPLTLATTTLTSTTQILLPPALDRACLCARVAADNKARDILVLDMRGITPLYDFFVLATGSSRRQIHTIAEEIDATLREQGDRRLAIEGYEASSWVVQDYGDVMVHVFNPQAREYYALEELWADAPRIDWQNFELSFDVVSSSNSNSADDNGEETTS